MGGGFYSFVSNDTNLIRLVDKMSEKMNDSIDKKHLLDVTKSSMDELEKEEHSTFTGGE